jgi:hypothetical protein
LIPATVLRNSEAACIAIADVRFGIRAKAADGDERSGVLPQGGNPSFGIKSSRVGQGTSDLHQAVLLREWQRPQQDGIHQGKDRRVGSNAQRQRQNGGECETRRPAQLPQCQS